MTMMTSLLMKMRSTAWYLLLMCSLRIRCTMMMSAVPVLIWKTWRMKRTTVTMIQDLMGHQCLLVQLHARTRKLKIWWILKVPLRWKWSKGIQKHSTWVLSGWNFASWSSRIHVILPGFRLWLDARWTVIRPKIFGRQGIPTKGQNRHLGMSLPVAEQVWCDAFVM